MNRFATVRKRIVCAPVSLPCLIGLVGSSLRHIFECSDAARLTLNPIGLDLGSWPRRDIDLNLYLEPSSAQRRRSALDQVQLRRPIPAPPDSPGPKRTKPPPSQCFQHLVRTIAARRPLYQGSFGRTM
ncbi:hypothetical protein P3H15_31135 [Rhodococcus sp. T2V]|uniref:hypothetical protein n=1 Tax=Rhodococcus sp. T2V TaxID=3034164 RepID=UPI0023E14C9C|nr:hypothetical protein [Rhodococcus sp. T2V]MDF3309474.1 hypothetical protein [Rhodococcus sp. T2V]